MIKDGEKWHYLATKICQHFQLSIVQIVKN